MELVHALTLPSRYAAALGGLEAEIVRLRNELRQLEASHTAHKQYIEDNDLVLEHLANRTEEIATANGVGCDGNGSNASSPDSDAHPAVSPTAELLRVIKTTATPIQQRATSMSVHVAVESEVELSRLAKVCFCCFVVLLCFVVAVFDPVFFNAYISLDLTESAKAPPFLKSNSPSSLHTHHYEFHTSARDSC